VSSVSSSCLFLSDFQSEFRVVKNSLTLRDQLLYFAGDAVSSAQRSAQTSPTNQPLGKTASTSHRKHSFLSYASLGEGAEVNRLAEARRVVIGQLVEASRTCDPLIDLLISLVFIDSKGFFKALCPALFPAALKS